MRLYLLFCLVTCSYCFSQDNDTSYAVTQKPITEMPRYQLSFGANVNFGEDGGPYFSIAYLTRLRNKLIDSIVTTHLSARYLSIATDLGNFPGQYERAIVTKFTPSAPDDTLRLGTFFGTTEADYNLKLGITRARLSLFSNQLSGIQWIFTWYGTLGYTRQSSRYVTTYQDEGAQLQFTTLEQVLGDRDKLTGLRTTDYLRVGAGVAFGADYYIALVGNHTRLIFGMRVDLMNIGLNMRVRDTINRDPDQLLTEAPKSWAFHSDPGIYLRVGVVMD